MIISKAEQFFRIINSEEEAREATNGRYVLAFMASWAQPCRAMVEEIERVYPRIKRKLDDLRVGLGYIDIDNQELKVFLREARIDSIPVFFAYNSGRQVGELYGLRLGGELERFIDLYSHSERTQEAHARV